MKNQGLNLVEEMNKLNLVKYGAIQPCCQLYLLFCRCKNTSNK
jgi:hypothetical protein